MDITGSTRAPHRVVICAHILAVAALSCASGSAIARTDVAAGGGGALHLRTGAVQTSPGSNLLTNGLGIVAGSRYVVQLDGPMTAERSEVLVKAGITLGDYLPDNAWIVKLDQPGIIAIRAIPFVSWLGAFDNAWKIDPEIGARPYASAERKSLAALGLCQVVVVVFENESPDAAVDAMVKAGGQVIGGNLCGPQWMIDAVLTPVAARALATLPTVQFIEDAPEASLRNDSNRWILQSNVSGQTPIWNAGIHGEGQVGGLIDDTPRETHCMFDDSPAPGSVLHRKFIGWRNTTSAAFHGTHTAGTMAGDNAPFGVYSTNDGLAYAAKISFSGLNAVTSNPSTLQPRLQDQHNDGARVHSNSWGDDGTVVYTTWCRQIDLFTWANEDSVVAFAVTNLGSLKTPENSINCLAVGASNDSPSQNTFCSGGQGPTVDGRRKPEVYAPGCNTQSADSATTCGVTPATGTSMACPAISGAGLLARQYFTAGYYPTGAAVPANGFTPTGALIRAALLNGTVDMTNITGYPSNREGWGRLLLDDSLAFSADARKLLITDVRNAQGLTTGQQVERQIVCNSSGLPLKITLVWTGPAATVNASDPVINNLDLEVVSPFVQTYRGNAFAAGQSSTTGVADLKNNVEQFLLNAPTPGTYTVRVKGTTVNQGPQGFAVVITGDVTEPCSPPTIELPPETTIVTEGDMVAFSVGATGSGLSYQWRFDGSPLADDGRISGSNGPMITINPVVTGDTGLYDAVVGNACDETVSASALLIVNLANPCVPDLDGLAGLDVADIFFFLSLWFADGPAADWDTLNGVDVPDIFSYLSDWFAGC